MKSPRPLVLSRVIFFLMACSAEEPCRPGNCDGAWRTVNGNPPPVKVIKSSLVGMPIASAGEFFGEGGKVEDVLEDGITYRVWAFERRRALVYKDCNGPDRTKFSQRVLVVKAEHAGGIISSCVIQIRGSLASQPQSIPEILASPPAPLDSEPSSCVSP